MAKRNKITTNDPVHVPIEEAESASLVGTEIPCPNHEGNMLIVQQAGEVLFALDNCPVRNNMFRNQRVWEKTLSPKPKSKAVIEEMLAEEGES